MPVDRPVPARARRRARSLATTLAVLLVGCAPDGEPTLATTLDVFAASSLADAFDAIGEAFEETNPGVRVRFTYSGSQVLRLQIEQGARADLFASADPAHLDALVDAGLIRARRAFAVNRLALIVPRANPAGLVGFDDLPRARRIVIGSAAVPVGAYTRILFATARPVLGSAVVDSIEASVVSEENNVRLVRAKVELGEADAAIVYRTDALASDRVVEILIPEALKVSAEYYIGSLRGSDRLVAANDFIAFLSSDAGRRILTAHGFEADG